MNCKPKLRKLIIEILLYILYMKKKNQIVFLKSFINKFSLNLPFLYQIFYSAFNFFDIIIVCIVIKNCNVKNQTLNYKYLKIFISKV